MSSRMFRRIALCAVVGFGAIEVLVSLFWLVMMHLPRLLQSDMSGASGNLYSALSVFSSLVHLGFSVSLIAFVITVHMDLTATERTSDFIRDQYAMGRMTPPEVVSPQAAARS